jgi:tRNA A-37 threonylcarbamoyl transferase component Bud32
MVWATGQLLQSGKYQVIRQIGGGGFGLTYLAEDQILHRQVVIKAPNRTFEQEQDYEKSVRRFQREGQVLAKISHPNVVQVVEFFQEAEIPCLVMEYVEGETLNEYIRLRSYLPQAEAVKSFRQLADALQIVHQVDLIHCDIHPGNIILRHDKEPILIDFGSTKSLKPMTYTVTTTLNESFTPYEQRKGDPQQTWDVYGLAATLYFAVTGQKPQPATDRKLDGDQLKPPQKYRSELSDWLNQAILRGMALEAQERSPSMQDWLSLLQPPPSKPQPKFSARQSEPFPWRAVAVLLFVSVLAGTMTGLYGSLLWAVAGASIILGAGFGAGVGAGVGFLFGTLPLSWLLFGTAVGAFIGDGALKWALTRDFNGDWAWSGSGAKDWLDFGSLIGSLTGGVIGGLIGGWDVDSEGKDFLAVMSIIVGVVVGVVFGGSLMHQFTGIDVRFGFSMVPLDIMIVAGIVSSTFALRRQYPYGPVCFVIFSLFSTLGSALGGGLGWWFRISGVYLPM